MSKRNFLQHLTGADLLQLAFYFFIFVYCCIAASVAVLRMVQSKGG